MRDLIIIGGGPAGLSAALAAKQRRLNYLVLERGVIADTVFHYPIARPLFSTSDEIELEAGALRRDRKPTREEVLRHFANVIRREQINIRTHEEARRIEVVEDGFEVETDRGKYSSRTVLVAVGGFGIKRRLQVPGENDDRVTYQLSDAHPYSSMSVLVVGGGNSAAEAALFLEEAGADVTFSIRRPDLDYASPVTGVKIKPWVREPLEMLESEGRIRIIRSSQVMAITPEVALLQVGSGSETNMIEVGCDHIFALIGADPDTRLLEEAGARIASDGRPVYSEDYETTVPGLYIAGHVTREMHMKNALVVGQKVARHIASTLREEIEAFAD